VSGRNGVTELPTPPPVTGGGSWATTSLDSAEPDSEFEFPYPTRPEGSDRPSSAEETDPELRQVLDEIDHLSDEMRRRQDPEHPAEGVLAEDAPPRDIWDEDDSATPTISPYLDERLALASASMTAFGRDLRDLGEQWQRLQVTASQLEEAIGNATLESGFLRSAEELPGAAPLPGADHPSGVPGPAKAWLSSSRAPGAAPTGPYGGFTVARYNSTIGNLKARRLRLAWWTVAFAAGISAILVTLAVVAQEAMPVIWLAVLPAVWMIPVPFFVISFFSTQRVLRRNQLGMTGNP
jgi:hypothetical protein